MLCYLLPITYYLLPITYYPIQGTFSMIAVNKISYFHEQGLKWCGHFGHSVYPVVLQNTAEKKVRPMSI
jgi:hypothetical protein